MPEAAPTGSEGNGSAADPSAPVPVSPAPPTGPKGPRAGGYGGSDEIQSRTLQPSAGGIEETRDDLASIGLTPAISKTENPDASSPVPSGELPDHIVAQIEANKVDALELQCKLFPIVFLPTLLPLLWASFIVWLILCQLCFTYLLVFFVFRYRAR